MNAEPIPLPFVPPNAPAFDTSKFTHAWPYQMADGRLICWVTRRVDSHGEKKVRPWSWCQLENGSEGWACKAPADGVKPIYRLRELAESQMTDGTFPIVVVCEGEKSADAAQKLLPHCICISWLGGASCASKADWSCLKGMQVILWPDFDAQEETPRDKQPGWKAMMQIANAIRGFSKVQILNYEVGEKTHGWDAADALAEGWDEQKTIDFIKERKITPWPPACQPAQKSDVVVSIPMFDIVPGEKWAHLDGKNPATTIENFNSFLGYYGIEIKYDQICKETLISIPGHSFSGANYRNDQLSEISSLLHRNNLKGIETYLSYVQTVASKNSFNPVKDWIDSKPWDNDDRFNAIKETIGAKRPDVLEIVLRRWMLSAVHTAYTGKASHVVMVLQGLQGAGKGRWIKSLVPPSFSHLIKEGRSIDTKSKDSISQAISCWICELGELDSTLKKDIPELKAFLTSDRDEIRAPYTRQSCIFPRQTVFCASVNDSNFLADETGNRRFGVIALNETVDENGNKTSQLKSEHGIDMQQVWAQVAHWYAMGERHWFDRAELAVIEENNKDHKKSTAVGDCLLGAYDWDSESMWREWKGTTQILREIGYEHPTNSHVQEIGYALQSMNIEKKKTNGRMTYFVPKKL